MFPYICALEAGAIMPSLVMFREPHRGVRFCDASVMNPCALCAFVGGRLDPSKCPRDVVMRPGGRRALTIPNASLALLRFAFGIGHAAAMAGHRLTDADSACQRQSRARPLVTLPRVLHSWLHSLSCRGRGANPEPSLKKQINEKQKEA